MATNQAAVLITGGLATGKTAVAKAVGEGLEARGAAHIVIDLDWLCWAWAPALGADDLHSLLCENLAAMVPYLLARGLRHIVLCRAMRHPSDVEAIRVALGRVPMHVVRLTVDANEARRRLVGRDAGDELVAHLAELPAFALAAERAAPESPSFDSTDDDPPTIADALLRWLRWPLPDSM